MGFYRTTKTGITYEIENGEVSIIEYVGENKNIIIPDTIEGFPVTNIVEYCFLRITK